MPADMDDRAGPCHPVRMSQRHAGQAWRTLVLRALILAVACAAVAAWAGPACARRDPAWRIDAIRYATIPGFPVRALVAGADSTRKVDKIGRASCRERVYVLV